MPSMCARRRSSWNSSVSRSTASGSLASSLHARASAPNASRTSPPRFSWMPRDLAQQLHAARLVVDELELGVVDDDQLLPGVLLAVDRLEDLRDAERMIVVDDQPLERAHRLADAPCARPSTSS